MGSVDQILIFASENTKKQTCQTSSTEIIEPALVAGKIIESYRFLLLLILSSLDVHVDKTMKSFSFYHLCRLETPFPTRMISSFVATFRGLALTGAHVFGHGETTYRSV